MTGEFLMNKEEILRSLINQYPRIEPVSGRILEAEKLMEECFEAGGKLLICGNGGSAADAEHIVGELMKEFRCRRKLTAEERKKLDEADRSGFLGNAIHPGLPAIALNTHTALATAILNDCDPSILFAQQVWGYGRTGDCLLALSTSGNSDNVCKAVMAAKARDMKTILLTGAGEGKICQFADLTIHLPEKDTHLIQELTLPVYHALCSLLEVHFWGV